MMWRGACSPHIAAWSEGEVDSSSTRSTLHQYSWAVFLATMLFFPSVPSLAVFFSPSGTLAAEQQIPLPIPQSSIDRIPLLGFGTWNLNISPENTTNAVSAALEAGYVHIDCALAYYNQKDVGRGIKEGLLKAGRQREHIWITSKLWNTEHKDVETALNNTLLELGVPYLDLYLMHWPVGKDPKGDEYEYDYVEVRLHTLYPLAMPQLTARRPGTPWRSSLNVVLSATLEFPISPLTNSTHWSGGQGPSLQCTNSNPIPTSSSQTG